VITCVGVVSSVFGVLFARSRGLSAEVLFPGIPILMSREVLAPEGAATVLEDGCDSAVEVAE
jgi:hypothetical protein